MTITDYIYKKRYRDELRRAVMKLLANPAASESVSSPNGGSRSVSYHSLPSLQAELRLVEFEIDEFRRSVEDQRWLNLSYQRWC